MNSAQKRILVQVESAMEREFPGREYILVLEGEGANPYEVVHSLGDNDRAANALMEVAGDLMGIDREEEGEVDA